MRMNVYEWKYKPKMTNGRENLRNFSFIFSLSLLSPSILLNANKSGIYTLWMGRVCVDLNIWRQKYGLFMETFMKLLTQYTTYIYID